MAVSDVKNLPVEEKLRIMEAIWIDLRDHVKNAPIHEAHRRLLDECRARGESNEAKLHDRDDVKHTIGG